MTSKVPLMIFMAAVGLIIGLWLPKPFQDDNASAESTSVSPSSQIPSPIAAGNLDQSSELTDLRKQFQDEIQKESDARRQLETKLSDLTARVNSLEKTGLNASANEPDPESANAISAHTQQGSRPGWINTQALIDAGVDEYQAKKIRDTYENVEMQKLYLRDKATREGWISDDKYRQQVEQLDNQVTSLSDQLSEKQYDAFLYATGRPNRVIIESTLSTSPAREAGIKSGDYVIRYNNTRVYTWSDLRDATTQCQTDSTVEVVLDRNGQQQQIFVPCGPLGVRLDNASVEPQQ